MQRSRWRRKQRTENKGAPSRPFPRRINLPENRSTPQRPVRETLRRNQFLFQPPPCWRAERWFEYVRSLITRYADAPQNIAGARWSFGMNAAAGGGSSVRGAACRHTTRYAFACRRAVKMQAIATASPPRHRHSSERTRPASTRSALPNPR